MRPLILAFLLIAALPSHTAAQDSVSLFNGRNLRGWKTDHAKARVRDGAIHVEPSRGWVRTEEPFGDFVLTFELRVGPRGGKAGLFVRGSPVFDRNNRPANAFRLTRTYPESTSTDAAWERWEVECVGQKLQLRVDGALVYAVDTLNAPHGYVGLWADTPAEFRAVEVRRLPPEPPADIQVVPLKTPGVVIPRILKEVKPVYTVAAVQRQIEGTVWIRAVVDATGSVGWLSIERSLDPNYGLDAAALAAAKQWKFHPATRDGTPVSVLITIELAFTLK